MSVWDDWFRELDNERDRETKKVVTDLPKKTAEDARKVARDIVNERYTWTKKGDQQ